MTRIDLLNKYLRDLVVASRVLQTEKTALQAAQARIPDINAELIDMRNDAQNALDRLNALQGTSLTLADIIAQNSGGAL